MSIIVILGLSFLIGLVIGGGAGWCVGLYMGEAWAREECDLDTLLERFQG